MSDGGSFLGGVTRSLNFSYLKGVPTSESDQIKSVV